MITREKLREAAVDRFGLVLLACIATYILLVSRDPGDFVGLLGAAPVLFTVILTINASHPGRTARLAVTVAITAAIAMGGVGSAAGSNTVNGVALILTSLTLLMCAVLILQRMMEHTKVAVQTIYAVLSVYVMFGLLFTYLDSGVGHIQGTFFAQSGVNQFAQNNYAYLSYITLTTVGFGDLTPATGIARSLIILEALIGQIFLVTLVARMVSLLGTERAPMNLTEPGALESSPEELDDGDEQNGDKE